jgi:hypothetical protein
MAEFAINNASFKKKFETILSAELLYYQRDIENIVSVIKSQTKIYNYPKACYQNITRYKMNR